MATNNAITIELETKAQEAREQVQLAPVHETTIYAEPVFHIGPPAGGFSITNSLLNSWLAVLVIIILCLVLRLKLKQIPSKIQHIFEILLEGALSLCDQVTNDRKLTLKIFPLVLSLFVFILVNNWLGLLPIVGSIGFVENSVFIPVFRAGTADINTTLALSIAIVIGSNVFGIVAIGTWKIFNKYVNIKALGGIVTKFRKDKSVIIVAPITFFVGILELIGEIAKVASLSFRLFGNVFAGEVLLASMGAIFLYLLPTPFLFLEVFIGLIQALIFSLLATVYFTIASQDHEEHEEEHGHKEELAHV